MKFNFVFNLKTDIPAKRPEACHIRGSTSAGFVAPPVPREARRSPSPEAVPRGLREGQARSPPGAGPGWAGDPPRARRVREPTPRISPQTAAGTKAPGHGQRTVAGIGSTVRPLFLRGPIFVCLHLPVSGFNCASHLKFTHKHTLDKWLSNRAISPLRGHLAMAGDIRGITNWGREGCGHRAADRAAARQPPAHGRPAQPRGSRPSPAEHADTRGAADNGLRCSKCAKLSDTRKAPSGRPVQSPGRQERPDSPGQGERRGRPTGAARRCQ